jgi:hypothetical protein
MIPDDVLLTHGEVRAFTRWLREAALVLIGVPLWRAEALDLEVIAAAMLGRVTKGTPRYDRLSPELEIESPKYRWSGWPWMPEALFRAVRRCRNDYYRQRHIDLEATATQNGVTKEELTAALKQAPRGRRGGWARMLLRILEAERTQ